MSKELFPEYIRTHYQQRADQALRATEHERLAKVARSNPHGVRRFFFTRLIALLRKVKITRAPSQIQPRSTIRHRRT